jgi:dTDP-4-amino-4,6-dideoxygalactose transaminase
VKLDWLDRHNAARRQSAELYEANLPEGADSPWWDPRSEPSFGVYPVRVGAGRAWVRNELRHRKIQTRVYHWPALHAHGALAGRFLQRTRLINAAAWSQEELCLPVFPGLRAEEVLRVTEALAEILAEVRAMPDRPARGPSQA